MKRCKSVILFTVLSFLSCFILADDNLTAAGKLAKDNYIKIYQSPNYTVPSWFRTQTQSVNDFKVMKSPPVVQMKDLANSDRHILWFSNFTPDIEASNGKANEKARHNYVVRRTRTGTILGEKSDERNKIWNRAQPYLAPSLSTQEDNQRNVFGY